MLKIGIPKADIETIEQWNRAQIRATRGFEENNTSLHLSDSQEKYKRIYEMHVLPILNKSVIKPITKFEMALFLKYAYHGQFCKYFDRKDIEKVMENFFKRYPVLKEFFEAIDIKDFLRSIKGSTHNNNYIDISEHGKQLILTADDGETDLQAWIANIFYAWHDLHIVRKPIIGGVFKWRCGNIVHLTNSNVTLGPDIVHKNDEKVVIERKLIEQYAHETYDLFECFFKIFPKIDIVKTESISGLGFENPFAAVAKKPLKIARQEFLDHALLCKRSTEFNEQWKQLKQSCTLAAGEGQIKWTPYTLQRFWDVVTKRPEKDYTEAFRVDLHRNKKLKEISDFRIEKGKIYIQNPSTTIPQIRKILNRFVEQ
jgi:hypothetical protein